ncbi:MAG: UbiA family prenyltransferase [Ignisphaera sp.]
MCKSMYSDSKIVDWLRLFRAQTAPATVMCLLVPYLLAGGRNIADFVVLFVLSHLLHFFSFGHNSVMDYWLDIHDPSKKHHPLVSGKIGLRDAHKVIHYGGCLTAFLIALYSVYKNPLSLAPFLMYVVFGHAYNDGLDHLTTHSWISISLCFTSLSMYGYILVKGFTVDLLLIALWSFLTIFYQIAFEGNYKDLWNPLEEHNLLRRYQLSSNPPTIRGDVALMFFFVRSVLNTAVLIVLALTVLREKLFLLLLILLTFFEVMFTYKLYKYSTTGRRREDVLDLFGKAEAIEFFRIASLTEIYALFFIAYGLMYYVLMNKLLWGTSFGPRV